MAAGFNEAIRCRLNSAIIDPLGEMITEKNYLTGVFSSIKAITVINGWETAELNDRKAKVNVWLVVSIFHCE
jgi:hypothetical protein